MSTFDFPLSTRAPRWPHSCAVCCGQADDKVLTTATTYRDFRISGFSLIVFLKWKKYSLQFPFPVCTRHRKLCWLLDLPARWGFINACFYWLLIPGILWLMFCLSIGILFGIKGDALDPYSKAAAALFWGLATVYYVAATIMKPVRLSSVHNGIVSISIRNDQYFQQFKVLNSSAEKNVV